MTLEQFEKELKVHDWYYQMSDSIKVWDKGTNNELRLKKLARDLGQEYIDLFDKYNAA
jgi:hypothetical protein